MLTLFRRYNVVCKHTSFLAVDSLRTEAVQGSMRAVTVPTPVVHTSTQKVAMSSPLKTTVPTSARVNAIRSDIDEVRNIMHSNMECLIERGEV